MQRHKTVYKASLIAASLLLLTTIALLGVSAWSPGRSQEKKRMLPRVANYVSALKVESVEAVKTSVVIRLRNVSRKNITGYSYCQGQLDEPVGRMDRVGTMGMATIAVNAVEEIQIGLRSLSANFPDDKDAVVNIVAAVMDDQSVEGYPPVAQALSDHSYGLTIQYRRIHQLIKNALSAADADLDQRARDLESRIWNLPVAPEPGQSSWVEHGLQSAKQGGVYFLQVYREEVTANSHKSKRTALQEILKMSEESLGNKITEKVPAKS
jgi:hypothetical protein